MHSWRLVHNLFARVFALFFTTAFASSAPAQPALLGKLDPVGNALFLTPLVQWSGGQLKRTLPLVNGVAVDLPNAALSALAASPLVSHIAIDRLVVGSMERTGATVGATTVRQELGYDGSGVGVAIMLLPSSPDWSMQIVWDKRLIQAGEFDQGANATARNRRVSWGSDFGDTGQNVVWGASDNGDTVVWGTSCSDPSCTPVIWSAP